MQLKLNQKFTSICLVKMYFHNMNTVTLNGWNECKIYQKKLIN